MNVPFFRTIWTAACLLAAEVPFGLRLEGGFRFAAWHVKGPCVWIILIGDLQREGEEEESNCRRKGTAIGIRIYYTRRGQAEEAD